MQKKVDSLNEYRKMCDMENSSSKIVTMFISRKGGETVERTRSCICIDQQKVGANENVHWCSEHRGWGSETKIIWYKNLHSEKCIQLKKRVTVEKMIMKSMVWSDALYGYEKRALRQNDMKSLQAFCDMELKVKNVCTWTGLQMMRY